VGKVGLRILDLEDRPGQLLLAALKS
jgi:hypothetical protein